MRKPKDLQFEVLTMIKEKERTRKVRGEKCHKSKHATVGRLAKLDPKVNLPVRSPDSTTNIGDILTY